jgi:site-specific DNA recombinase
LEETVWEAVKDAIQDPQLLRDEYQRRLEASGSSTDLEFEGKQILLALNRLAAQEDRITDAYVNEAMELPRYKQEMDKLAARRDQLGRTGREIADRAQQEVSSRQALKQLEVFCDQVAVGLDSFTLEEQQHFLRLVVERVTVSDGRVKVETVIPNQQDSQLRNARGEPVEPSAMPFDKLRTSGFG